MKSKFAISLPNIQSLYGRIFAIFWLTLLLVLVAVLVALHNDPRQQKTLSPDAARKFQNLAEHTTVQLSSLTDAEIKKFLRGQKKAPAALTPDELLSTKIRLFKRLRPKYSTLDLYFTTLEGAVIGMEGKKPRRYLKYFVAQSDDPSTPKQQVFGLQLLSGPFVVSDGQTEAWMYVAAQWRERIPFYAELLGDPLRLLLVTMLISTPLLLWLAWAISRPARRLQHAAERVTHGHFEKQPDLEQGPRELKQAGESFNQMVDALNHMLISQKRLLSDISHELRSPLTRLRMANALAIRKQGASPELERINTETDRLEQMIADLLSLSQMQLNSHVERSKFDLTELWQPVVDDALFEAEQVNKTLNYTPIPNVMIEGNETLLCSAVENVIRNAIKYATDQININFSIKEGLLFVAVSDDGCGIPADELNDIFRPFYRVSSARDRQSGGTGLGLAITKTAMDQHNGSVYAEINENGGLTVHLTFKYL